MWHIVIVHIYGVQHELSIHLYNTRSDQGNWLSITSDIYCFSCIGNVQNLYLQLWNIQLAASQDSGPTVLRIQLPGVQPLSPRSLSSPHLSSHTTIVFMTLKMSQWHFGGRMRYVGCWVPFEFLSLCSLFWSANLAGILFSDWLFLRSTKTFL